MNNYANYGYVVKAIDLVPLLKTDGDKNEFREMIDTMEPGYDLEDIEEFFIRNMVDGYPRPCFFLLNDECESEDLEIGVLYAAFDQSDLFIPVKTPKHNELNYVGVRPEFKQWVTWG